MQAEMVPESAASTPLPTRKVRPSEFVQLLVSRRQLERDLRFPERLTCRETGVVYVRDDEQG